MTFKKAEQERERSEETRRIEAAKRQLRQSIEEEELTARLEAGKQEKDKDAETRLTLLDTDRTD